MTPLELALQDPRSSVRLRAVMAAGTSPSADDVTVLVEQCAIESDFFVRDMLTWALIRQPSGVVVPLVLEQLRRPEVQARSQALHTLSKIGDPATWPAISEHLSATEDEVARPAWRAAVALAPADERDTLARRLATQLGRGDRETRLSLSRALAELGPDIVRPVLDDVLARRSAAPDVADHVAEVRHLLDDPDAGSSLAVERARREVALGRTRSAKG
jgi:HEAT repeat protein